MSLKTKLNHWGLDKLRKTNNIQQYLALSPNDIDALSLQDIDKILITLGQYQIYLQKELNIWSMRAEREKKIFKEKLDEIAKEKKGRTLAEKRAVALAEDEELQELKKKIEKAETYAMTLDKIPDAINSQIVNFRKIEDTKKAEMRNHNY